MYRDEFGDHNSCLHGTVAFCCCCFLLLVCGFYCYCLSYTILFLFFKNFVSFFCAIYSIIDEHFTCINFLNLRLIPLSY
ncbi:hypothetical protein RIF29_06609 [Crotalaria pallida]|uniref:Uncharacterized protein n=1 Tax=Crotalaria pallida TaxID=3830 RepID=A0AAN9J4H4_CROPI